MDVQKYVNYWLQKYNDGLYDNNVFLKQHIKQFFDKLTLCKTEDDIADCLYQDDGVDKTREGEKLRRNKHNMPSNDFETILFNICDFFHNDDGIIRFIFEHRISQSYFTEHLFKKCKKLEKLNIIERATMIGKYWPSIYGEIVANYEFNFLVGATMGGFGVETLLILPYLAELNLMGFITHGSCIGHLNAEMQYPFVTGYVSDEQYNAIKNIKYLKIKKFGRCNLYDIFATSEGTHTFIHVECCEIFKYYDNTFWEDIINALKTCKSSHLNWRELF